MQIVSASEFRTNQKKFLAAAKEGESVVLTSRLGKFKIIPVGEEETLTDRICRGLESVKKIREGKLARRSLEEII